MPNEPITDTQQQQYNNELRGALFRNDKGDNPKRPDYRGRCTIEDIQYKISGWLKTSHNGDRYMSLAFSKYIPTEPDDRETF